MLTIFATPKPFRDHIAVIQRNAIRSWTLLRPACEIILMGNDEGTADIAAEFGVRYVPEVARYSLDERLHAGDPAGGGPKKSFLTSWTPLELRCQGSIGIQTGLGRETSGS